MLLFKDEGLQGVVDLRQERDELEASVYVDGDVARRAYDRKCFGLCGDFGEKGNDTVLAKNMAAWCWGEGLVQVDID